MTIPNMPTTGSTSSNPAKPPPMDDKQVRLECLKQAVATKIRPEKVIELAKQMSQFVTGSTS